jgi:hypothetical protein
MFSIRVTKKTFWDNPVEGYIFFLNEDFQTASSLATLDVIEKDFYPHLKEILKKHSFEGKRGQTFVLSAPRDNKLIQFIFIGIGTVSKSGKLSLNISVAQSALRRICLKNFR